MKKLIALLLVLCMVLSLAACGDSGSGNNPGGDKQPTGSGTKDPTDSGSSKDPSPRPTSPDGSGETTQPNEYNETTAPNVSDGDLSNVSNPLGLNSLLLAAYFENALFNGDSERPAEMTMDMIAGIQTVAFTSESWEETSTLEIQTYYVTNKDTAASEEDYKYTSAYIFCDLDFTPDLSGDTLDAIWEDLKLVEKLQGFGVSQIPIENLSGLAHHSNLSGVILEDVAGLTSLAGLESSAKLKSLTCRDCGDLSDISALAGSNALTDVTFENCSISDLSVMTGFTKLNTLYIQNCPISDIAPLANLPKLEKMTLQGTNVTALPAGGTTKLEYLYANHNNGNSGDGLSDITHISEWLAEDCDVYLSGCPISDLSGFVGSPAIDSLSLGNTLITDESLKVFQQITVESLSLGHANSESHFTDLSGLAGCTFTELSLTGCSVTDLSPLLSCPNLTYLDLQASAVTDVSCLATMPELKNLYLGYTEVSDVSALAACPKLEYLSLRNCKNITDISALAASASLKTIAVDYDAFKDLSAFENTSIEVSY